MKLATVQYRMIQDLSAEVFNGIISLVVPSQNFTCGQALIIRDIFDAYVIFGKSTNHYKMLNLNLFSSENHALQATDVRHRFKGTTAALLLCM